MLKLIFKILDLKNKKMKTQKTKKGKKLIKRYVKVFTRIKELHKKQGFFLSPTSIAIDSNVSKNLGRMLIETGIAMKDDERRYHLLVPNMSIHQLIEKFFNEKIDMGELETELNKKQTKIEFENKGMVELENDDKIKNKRVKKETINKFFKYILFLLSYSGELIDKKTIEKDKKKYKLKYSVIDSLLYSGMLKMVGDKYIITSNFNDKQIKNWSDISARHYSYYNSNSGVPKIVENEVVNSDDIPQKQFKSVGKQIYCLSDYTIENQKNSKSKSIEINIPGQEIEKSDWDNILVNESPVETSTNIPQNKTEVIKFVCDLNDDEIKKLINLLPKIFIK